MPQQPAPRAARDFAPLFPEPDATTRREPLPAPTRSLLESLLGYPVTASNRAALAADLAAPRGPKRIVVCADGTWNTPKAKRGQDHSTNVWRIYELVKDRGGDGVPQLKYYHAGVGTTGSRVRKVFDGMTGRGLTTNVRDCYDFLVEHYRPGDFVYLFGFSRGAYTVRSLAGLVRNSGILDAAKVAAAGRTLDSATLEAVRLYRDRTPATRPVAAKAVGFRSRFSHPDLTIDCIGVWDTVGALGVPMDGPIGFFSSRLEEFHDVTLSSYVDCAFHALALDERRGAFMPTLWTQQPHARAAGQVLEQVWFHGAHSDVGGGYAADERGLANVTLRWMVGRVAEHCKLEFDLGPIAHREATPHHFVAHDSMTPVYRALDLLRLSAARDRTVDGGLCEVDDTPRRRAVRDAQQVVTEALHPCVRELGPDVLRREAPPCGTLDDYLRRREVAQAPVRPVPRRDRRRVMTAAEIGGIALERESAPGVRLSRVELAADGTASYEGAEAAPRAGRLTGRVTPAQFADLAQRFVSAGFFTLPDEFGRDEPRGAAAMLTVDSGRRRKSVVDVDESAPRRVQALQQAVDDLADAIAWQPVA